MRWACAIVLVVALVPALGSAQQSADVEARARFEEGRAAYDAGRFEEAVTAFREAYLLSGRPALLYNIGQSELRLEHHALALEAFEGYLRQGPDDADRRAEVEERVRVLRAMGPQPGPGGTSTGGGFEPIEGRIGTWVALGVGVAAGAVAIGLYYDGASIYDGLLAGCGARPGGCTDAQLSASGLYEREIATNVLWGVAGAGLVTAIVLYVVEGLREPESEAVSFEVGPTGVALRGRF